MGDTTGYGYHGDFINGWKDIAKLQSAHKDCITAQDCPTLGNQPANPQTLLFPAIYEEEVGFNGPIAKLPGANPVNFSTIYTPRAKIAANNGMYVVSVNKNTPLKASADMNGATIFEVNQVDGDAYLKNIVDFMFVTADQGGKNPLIADKEGPSGWESFALTKNADGTYSFLARANGKYVTLQGDGSLEATSTAVGPTSSFKLSWITSA